MIASPSLQHSITAASSRMLLDSEKAEALLEALLQSNWSRLSSEYDDPLGMLFANKARQWTAGWDSHQQNLYLLIWETDSWQEKATWKLYQNGRLIFEEAEKTSRYRHQMLEMMLESDELPLSSFETFLSPVVHYQLTHSQRTQNASSLLNTILVRPEIFEHLKEPLFQALEIDLGNPEWPLLEVLKLHRLAHKNALIRLFRQCVDTGLIRVLRDNTRLDRAITLLQEDYFQYGYKVSPLFRNAYDQASNEFRRLLTDGFWRAKLRFKVPAR